MSQYYILAFFCYFFVLMLVGVLSKHKQRSNEEFIVGNRSLNFWLTALSAHASDMSAWLFMGLPMAIYLEGLSGAWIAIGLLIGMWCNWQFISKKLRKETEAYDTFTLSSFFEKRFNDPQGVIRILTALMLVFFLTHYLSASLIAMGLLLDSIFGIDYYVGLTFATCVVVAYTFGGGYVTIAWTDLFQALFLLAVILFVPFLAWVDFDLGWHTLQTLNEKKPGYISLIGELTPLGVLNSMTLAIAWGLGYFGMPHILTKFMGIQDPNEIVKSKWVGMTWQFLALFAAIAVGITGAAYFQEGLLNPQLVFVEQVKILFHPFFAGLILCGVIAANLSTMDSQLLVCASAISEDLYKKLFGEYASPKTLVRISRGGVIFIAFTALLIAFFKSETIMETVFYAWGGLGSSIGPIVIMSLYSKKTNKYGAVAGICVGAFVAMFWPSINPKLLTLQLPTMIPGFFSGLLTIAVVSKLTYTSAQ